MAFVDLSHTLEDGLVTYEGLPAPKICDFLSRLESESIYAPGVSFQIGQINLCANSGTYIDTPFHRFEDGYGLHDLALERIAAVPAVCITGSGRVLQPELLDGINVQGKAVLFHTGWDQHWPTATYRGGGHPYVSPSLANELHRQGAWLVGIDSYNIDDISDMQRPVHSILLGAGIPIVEHMTGLDALPEHGFEFYAIPPKIVGLGSFPVRAFAKTA